jgi:hypothetical protein
MIKGANRLFAYGLLKYIPTDKSLILKNGSSFSKYLPLESLHLELNEF